MAMARRRGRTIAMRGQQSVSRAVTLGLNKSLVVDLPRDARDVLVSDPASPTPSCARRAASI